MSSVFVFFFLLSFSLLTGPSNAQQCGLQPIIVSTREYSVNFQLAPVSNNPQILFSLTSNSSTVYSYTLQQIYEADNSSNQIPGSSFTPNWCLANLSSNHISSQVVFYINDLYSTNNRYSNISFVASAFLFEEDDTSNPEITTFPLVNIATSISSYSFQNPSSQLALGFVLGYTVNGVKPPNFPLQNQDSDTLNFDSNKWISIDSHAMSGPSLSVHTPASISPTNYNSNQAPGVKVVYSNFVDNLSHLMTIGSSKTPNNNNDQSPPIPWAVLGSLAGIVIIAIVATVILSVYLVRRRTRRATYI